MNRNQEAPGVVLTGYISNSEAFSPPVCAAAGSSGDEPEAPGPRWAELLWNEPYLWEDRSKGRSPTHLQLFLYMSQCVCVGGVRAGL